MLPPRDPFAVTDDLRRRLARAVVAQARIDHAGLNTWLTEQLGGTGAGALIGDPVIEGVPPFPTADRSMAALAGTLLHPATIAALDNEGEQRFPRDRHPFQHQLAAWETLAAEQPRSLLVSSGTGSGKTECFLVPLIDSLARQDAAAGAKHPLVGVQAIMLYPLNALIASQRERLSAWTRPFDGRIRFALYNRLLKRKEPAAAYAKLAAEAPEQVHDREHLWAAPPPILVTNVTMLEYLTIRADDRPLLERSAGKLRWIIIDEAHSYIGSAAAEIALLLRRVLLAFGVGAANVRFVATSATIGKADAEGQARLRRFLADLAGVAEDRVTVVIGTPDTWVPPGNGVDGPIDASDAAALPHHPRIKVLAEALQQPGGLTLRGADAMLGGRADPRQVVAALARPQAGTGRPLLPSRIHRFLRAVPGLWSCIDPACSGPKPADWRWGAVLHQLTDRCPHCAALVLELESCDECGTPLLTAVDDTDRLLPRRAPLDADEFAAASDGDVAPSDEEDEAQPPAPGVRYTRLIADAPRPGLATVHVDRATGAFAERAGDGLALHATPRRTEEGVCPVCQSQGKLRPLRYGAPFLIGNAAPVMLDGVSGQGAGLPGEGRRLLSFTDSRQGTARFAASIETQGERGYVRGVLYHLAQKAGAGDPAKQAELEANVAQLKAAAAAQPALAPALASAIEEFEKQLAAAAGGGGLRWADAVEALANDRMLDGWLRREVWSRRDPRFEKPSCTEFGRFLALRELARRPARANSLETLGLARLRWPLIEAAPLPPAARSAGLTAPDWRDFLTLLVDRVRSNFAINVPVEDVRWLLPRFGRRRNIAPPGAEIIEEGDLVWPFAVARSRIAVVQMLAEATRLSLDSAQDCNALNEMLGAAWAQLRPLFETAGSVYALDFGQAEIASVRDAWRCPVTRRVITTRAFGRTPAGVRPASSRRDAPLLPLRFPVLPQPFPNGAAARAAISDWLAADAYVAELRRAGLWTDLQDRAALLTPYIRAEEHSAQQEPERLRVLEKAFTAGSVNLLACSTTMEMGVDIGAVEAVMMTNVPPSIANYRQRVGRAGRRGQGFATSLTLARDTPLDRRTFAAPSAYLRQQLAAPRVSLDAPRIVQRHVNALALAHWLAAEGGQLLRARTGDFFALPAAVAAKRPDTSPHERFAAWLAAPGTAAALAPALAALLAGTALAADHDVLTTAAAAFAQSGKALLDEWQALQAEAAAAPAGAATNSVTFRLQRLADALLLATLADRGVLPGHGFPGQVVAFVANCQVHPARRGDSLPTRTADVALREYAPGAEVVIDGLVWRSAGVTLNWHAPASADGVNEVQALRWHWRCDACGAADSSVTMPTHCAGCGAAIVAPRRFLSPAGYRVDWFDEPHADSAAVDWIEPQPVSVSVRGVAWTSLPDPGLGRGRASADGLIFHHSLGQGEDGYHVCLGCGRTAERREDLKNHRSLVPRRRGDGRCPGNDNPFLVQGPLALGCETRTDVAELQLAGLDASGTAWALASALRVALCRRMGVEPAEIGLTVEAGTSELAGPTHSIFLYDTASGGAGLAVRLFDDLPGLLQDVSQLLDCPEPGCEKGCGACVLSADLYGKQEIVDRRAALARVEAMLAALAAPVHDPALADARLSRPAADAIAAGVMAGDTVTLFIPGSFQLEDLAKEPFTALAATIARRQGRLRLAVSDAVVADADAAWRLGLRDQAMRLDAELVTGQGADGWLAMLAGPTRRLGWRCSEAAAVLPGPRWGQGTTAPVICGTPKSIPAVQPLDPARLLPATGAAVIEVPAGSGAPLAGFGKWFAGQIAPVLMGIGGWHPGQLHSVAYSDRYLRSPLTILLALRALTALRTALNGKEGMALELRTSAPDPRESPRRPWHDYWRQDARDSVLMTMARMLNFDPRFGEPAAHARRLDLRWQDGSRTIVYLDQGFGWFRMAAGPPFDFGAPPEVQAKGLWALQQDVRGGEASYLACQFVSAS